MSKTYFCEICKKTYTTYMGFWKHNKKYHKEDNEEVLNTNTNCKYCNQQLASRQGRWRHEQKCQQTKRSCALFFSITSAM